MTDRLPNLSTLSHAEKDSLIVRLFDELDHFRGVVEDLQARVAVVESENQSLRAENKFLRTENETLRSKVKDLEGQQISQGTLKNWIQQCFNNLGNAVHGRCRSVGFQIQSTPSGLKWEIQLHKSLVDVSAIPCTGLTWLTFNRHDSLF